MNAAVLKCRLYNSFSYLIKSHLFLNLGITEIKVTVLVVQIKSKKRARVILQEQNVLCCKSLKVSI